MEKDPLKCIAAQSLMSLECSHHGFVVKEGGRFKSMQPKYFILYNGCLYYYKDFKSNKEQGAFCLASYEVKEDLCSDDVFGISLVPKMPGKKAYYFVVSTKEERAVWIEKLKKEMERIAGDGSEMYDYCDEGLRDPPQDEPHNYEPTDEIEKMKQQPKAGNSNTKQPNLNLTKAYPMPEQSPPPVPFRTTDSPTTKSVFMPPKPRTVPMMLPKGNETKRHAPQPPAPQPPFKPPPVLGTGKPVPCKPDRSSKPSVQNKAMAFQSDEYNKKQAGVNELAVFLRMKRQNYEIQTLKEKQNSEYDDSDDSESYLDLEGESIASMNKRQPPLGANSNMKYEMPRTTSPQDELDEKVLPKSAIQHSLNRQAAEGILNGIQKDGMYLLRKGTTGLQVLTVLTEEGCKHYQIFEKSGLFNLQEGDPEFKTVANLLHHYYKSSLPKCSFKLKVPYS